MVEEGETQPGNVTSITPGSTVCVLKVRDLTFLEDIFYLFYNFF